MSELVLVYRPSAGDAGSVVRAEESFDVLALPLDDVMNRYLRPMAMALRAQRAFVPAFQPQGDGDGTPA